MATTAPTLSVPKVSATDVLSEKQYEWITWLDAEMNENSKVSLVSLYS